MSFSSDIAKDIVSVGQMDLGGPERNLSLNLLCAILFRYLISMTAGVTFNPLYFIHDKWISSLSYLSDLSILLIFTVATLAQPSCLLSCVDYRTSLLTAVPLPSL